MNIQWNINPILFTIPQINVSIHWYGLFFALGFIIGYYFVVSILKKQKLNTKLADELLIYLFIGTLLGARLGHCLIYEPSYYFSNPIEILKLWHGGLASHGGGLGLTIAIYLFSRKNKFSFLAISDILSIPMALEGCFIRIGNFFNSEIYGINTDSPFGIVFSRIDQIPKHPVQLYESLVYFIIFLFLLYLYKKSSYVKKGVVSSCFLISVFTSRFFLEFLKPEQANYDVHILTVGQILSIPFVIFGIFILIHSLIRNNSTTLLQNTDNDH
ncbi:MAG: prolipoprotein diacylglyceryl transferase [Succinivibrionaceae bacterium]